MKLRNISALMIVLLTIGLGTMIAGSNQYAKFLTIDDIQKITGMTGVKQLPQSASAEGEMIFVARDDKPILTALFLPSSAYAGAKSSKSGMKSGVQGIGEEAFVGPSSGPPLYILVFRKGSHTVVINTELEGKNPTIPIDKVMALAKLIASRIP